MFLLKFLWVVFNCVSKAFHGHLILSGGSQTIPHTWKKAQGEPASVLSHVGFVKVSMTLMENITYQRALCFFLLTLLQWDLLFSAKVSTLLVCEACRAMQETLNLHVVFCQIQLLWQPGFVSQHKINVHSQMDLKRQTLTGKMFLGWSFKIL